MEQDFHISKSITNWSRYSELDCISVHYEQL